MRETCSFRSKVSGCNALVVGQSYCWNGVFWELMQTSLKVMAVCVSVVKRQGEDHLDWPWTRGEGRRSRRTSRTDTSSSLTLTNDLPLLFLPFSRPRSHVHDQQSHTQTQICWPGARGSVQFSVCLKAAGGEGRPTGTAAWRVINGGDNCSALSRFMRESGTLKPSVVTGTDSNPPVTSSQSDHITTGVWT